MRPSIVSSSLVLITSFVSTGSALQAFTDSPCAVQCGNVLESTSGNDIVCPDSDYAGTSAGITFQGCVGCQVGSKYVDPASNETDLQLGLYNLRYAMSWCLFGYPNNPVGDSPCTTSRSCGQFQTSIESAVNSTNETEYSYCTDFDSFNGKQLMSGCDSCLGLQPQEYYLKNFFTALQAGCQQKPTPGNVISIKGSLFSTTQVNITSPSATAAPFVPSSGLSLGSKIGIAVGAIILALCVAGFCIIWNGKRRRRAVLRQRQRESGFDDEWRRQHMFAASEQNMGTPSMTHATPPMGAVGHGGAFFDSPASQRPLAPWGNRAGEDESPASGFGEKVYFSPYTSTYNSPISAKDQIPSIARDWPTVERKGSIQDHSQPARDWSIDRKGSIQSGTGWSRDKKEKEQDASAIELQNVAPTLQHPGHGRRDSGGLTEEDAKRGAAL